MIPKSKRNFGRGANAIVIDCRWLLWGDVSKKEENGPSHRHMRE